MGQVLRTRVETSDPVFGANREAMLAALAEVDRLQGELAVDANASFLVKYANYDGAGVPFGGFADRNIAWFQAAYKY